MTSRHNTFKLRRAHAISVVAGFCLLLGSMLMAAPTAEAGGSFHCTEFDIPALPAPQSPCISIGSISSPPGLLVKFTGDHGTFDLVGGAAAPLGPNSVFRQPNIMQGPYTITQTPIPGLTTVPLDCTSESIPGANVTYGANSVTITLKPGDWVACNFQSQPSAPSTPGGTPVCIESTLVQTDPAAAGLAVGNHFTGTADNVYYQIISGTSSCSFNCLDGFDLNCDGKLGDFCPIELKLNRVKDAGICLELLAAAAAPAEATAAVPAVAPAAVSVAVSDATAVAVPGLARTGNETGVLGYVGSGLIAFGAVALASRRRTFRNHPGSVS